MLQLRLSRTQYTAIIRPTDESDVQYTTQLVRSLFLGTAWWFASTVAMTAFRSTHVALIDQDANLDRVYYTKSEVSPPYRGCIVRKHVCKCLIFWVFPNLSSSQHFFFSSSKWTCSYIIYIYIYFSSVSFSYRLCRKYLLGLLNLVLKLPLTSPI